MILRLIFLAIVAADLAVFWAEEGGPVVYEVAARPDAVPIPEPSPRAVQFQRSGLGLWVAGQCLTLAVPALFLVAGWSGRAGRLAHGRGRPLVAVVAIYAALYLAFDFALKLPFRYYAGYVRPHEYGLSIESLGHWLGDAGKALGLRYAGAVLFAWIPFGLMAWSPRRWWLWVGLLVLPFSAGSALLAPIVVDPLFNRFGPMRDKALEARIEALAARAGIEGSDIYEVDKSRETTTVNAYVTGLGGTKRVVLWDTLIRKLDAREVEAVMGHEMGHFVLNHVATGITLGSAGTLVVLYLLATGTRRVIARHGTRFGLDREGDVAATPLLLVQAQLLLLLTAPINNATSRWMEHEADRFALELTRDNHAAASSFAKLQADNLAVPFDDTFTRLFRATHPALGDRIAFCNGYRPWEAGGPLRYADRFRDR